MRRREVRLELPDVVIGRHEDDLGQVLVGSIPIRQHRRELAAGGAPAGAHVKQDELLPAHGLRQGDRRGRSALEERPGGSQPGKPFAPQGVRNPAPRDRGLGGGRKGSTPGRRPHPELVPLRGGQVLLADLGARQGRRERRPSLPALVFPHLELVPGRSLAGLPPDEKRVVSPGDGRRRVRGGVSLFPREGPEGFRMRRPGTDDDLVAGLRRRRRHHRGHPEEVGFAGRQVLLLGLRLGQLRRQLAEPLFRRIRRCGAAVLVVRDRCCRFQLQDVPLRPGRHRPRNRQRIVPRVDKFDRHDEMEWNEMKWNGFDRVPSRNASN
mmetsp:Transcript_19552/g.45570  ORF Transcript_19552/g.45570 Transcript_19552/m.45570 type:complete len:323 (-) Transcript_19552:47-1015(-)